MSEKKVRLIAFYLPQYHPIPENDAWWGKGFTEWTNVAKAGPLFEGHYQPRLPAELGYYDLRLPEARQAQSDLAQEHGLHGFCYYHYWFNGHRLLERPFNEVLSSGKPDFPFCLCWANENWTRAWDGLEHNVLIRQNYTPEDDREHLRWLAKAFQDPRYIRINEKPLFIVYRVNLLPDPLQTASIWREEARKLGIGDIYLAMVESRVGGKPMPDPRQIGFDAAIEFQPDGLFMPPPIKSFDSYGGLFDYTQMVEKMLRKEPAAYKRFPCVTPGWDNSSRRKNNQTIIQGSTPQQYRQWLEKVIHKFKPYGADEDLVFINAWNEWGEGAYLEPDQKWGRAYLEATRTALEAAAPKVGPYAKPVPVSSPESTAVDPSGSARPLVSVCIPTFNGTRYLKQTIQSVLDQTLSDFELIIADDCSTDETEALVRSLKDKRITFHRNPVRLGLAGNWNKCLSLAKAEFVCIFHQDDVMLPENLEQKIRTLRAHPKAGMAYSDVAIIGPNHEKRADHWFTRTEPAKDFISAAPRFFETLIQGENLICCPSVVLRRECYEKLSGFDPALSYALDWEMWLRIALRYDVAYVATPLVEYRVHENNETFRFKGIREIEEILRAKTMAFEKGEDLVPDPARLKQAVSKEIEKRVFEYLKSDSAPRSREDVAKAMSLAAQAFILRTNGISPEEARREFGAVMDKFLSTAVLPSEGTLDVNAYLKMAAIDLIAGRKPAAYENLRRAITLSGSNDSIDAAFRTKLEACGLLIKHGYQGDGISLLSEIIEEAAQYNLVHIIPLAQDLLNKIPDNDLSKGERKRKQDVENSLVKGPAKDWSARVLEKLIESDDLREAIKKHERLIDSSVIGLVRADAQAALDDGNSTLAKELTILGSFLEDFVASKDRGEALQQGFRKYPGLFNPNHPDVPVVSIIIPVYNKLGLTTACLASIREQTRDARYELIVVDNNSSDQTAAFLREQEKAGSLRAIINRQNEGFARACNQGAATATTDYLLFLNNDTEVREGWLEPLLSVLKQDAQVGAVGSKLLFPDGTIQHAGLVVIDDRKLPDPLVARHIYYKQPGEHPEAAQARTYQALTAACLMIRKTAFQEAGGFDEKYWNGYEDVDLCFRLGSKGWKLVYQPESVVTHFESQSGEERFKKVPDNISRLHERWLGKITPDLVIEQDGTVRQTRASKAYQPGANGRVLTSLVILTFNQLRYTKECIESIRKFTPEPHEIIFVDNGSTDGTLKWLKQGVRDNPHYKLIENSKNLGFAKGCNQGISAASGEYILLLNNDVVVTEHWLSGLLECLNQAPDIGLVGPMTNNISGPQRVPFVDYTSRDGLAPYAAAFREQHRYRRIPHRRIVGFCMLFRRTLAQDIGLLDESFGTGNFEDDDYGLRAELLGYRNVIAGDVFIHHYGNRSFIGNGLDYNGAWTGNRKLFTDKWSNIDAATPLGKKLWSINALDKARDLEQKGLLDKAVEAIIDGMRHAPEERELYYGLAEMLINAKQYNDALSTLAEMPQTGPDERKLVLSGYCEDGLSHADKAAAYAAQALSLNPSSAPALNLEGALAYRRGARAEAEDYFKKAAAADPGYGDPLINLGVLKWAADQKEEALNYLERGFMLAPFVADNIAAYHAAVTAAAAFGRAERMFLEAKTLAPHDRRIMFLLIDVMIKQEQYASAMREIEEAMVLFGIDDGILNAALEVRSKIGPMSIRKRSGSKNSLSLCMIVKNEEQNLAKCLMSVKPVVDEIIVVDTGSSDRTRDIAQAFGARVVDFPWTGDFAEARNQSLAKASGDWILVLDADETLSPLDHAELTRLISAPKTAYSLVTRNYVVPAYTTGWTANDGKYAAEEAGTGWFGSIKVRLFPRDSRIRFVNPVHELVEPSLKKVNVPVKDCDIPVHHYGKLDGQKALSKGEEYYLLGRKKLEQTGENADALRELAIQAGELKKYPEALDLWKRASALKPDMPAAYVGMAPLYLETGQYNEALAAARKAMELAPRMKEAIYNYALCEIYAGNAAQTISVLEKLVVAEPDYPAAEVLLAMAYCCGNKKEQGLGLFHKLREMRFNLADAIERVAGKLTSAGRSEHAVALLDAALESGNDTDAIRRLREQLGEKTVNV